MLHRRLFVFFVRHGQAVDGEYFGAGNVRNEIFLDEMECSGEEESILSCAHNDWLEHDCSHNEDAGVICYSSDVETTPAPTTPAPTTPVPTTRRPTTPKATPNTSPDTPTKDGTLILLTCPEDLFVTTCLSAYCH